MADVALPKSQASVRGLLVARRGRKRQDFADWLTYGFLVLGLLVMFTPVAWMVLSSFKTQASLQEFPPSILPYTSETAVVEGFDQPLHLFDVTLKDGSKGRLTQIRRVGKNAQMIDPGNPAAGRVTVAVVDAVPVRKVRLATENYTNLVASSGQAMGLYVYNSLFITIVATIITLVMNSMAAFALSAIQCNG
jgi:alpha-1,4-digalacturonate transport system permease protein